MAPKPRGVGLKALVAGPLRKELFLRLPLSITVDTNQCTGGEVHSAHLFTSKATLQVILVLEIVSLIRFRHGTRGVATGAAAPLSIILVLY